MSTVPLAIPCTVGSFLRAATAQLTQAGIATSRLDTLILLEDTLRMDRSQLLAEPEASIATEQRTKLNGMIRRRAAHEPLAYIRRKTEFYGREFYVDYRVLVPRPESETIIDLLRKLPSPDYQTIIDVGTGSGSLAITAKLEVPHTSVIAVDIDPACLEVASYNIAKHAVDIKTFASDLITNVDTATLGQSLLVCNLPYVPDDFHINTAATHEPKLAIFGGSDGLNLYRKLFTQIVESGARPGYILTEALPLSHATLASIAGDAHYVLERTDDFIQIFRKVVVGLVR